MHALSGMHKNKRELADGTIKTYYYAWRGGPRIYSEPHTAKFLVEVMKERYGSKGVEAVDHAIYLVGPDANQIKGMVGAAERARKILKQ
tara:strand:+ start:4039 stop:4305 length:267 start_codon:yes stop_codon:yes gene_type:complete